MKAKEILEKNKEIILYLFFGVLTVVLDILIYELLYVLSFGNFWSTVVSWIVSVIFAFFTNKNYVFTSGKTKSALKEFIYFFLGRSLTGLFNIAFMLITVDGLGLNNLLCKTISTVIVVLLNYLISKFIIF